MACKADVEIILAFKAYALWKTFPIFRNYVNATTASSLFESRLALEEFGSKAHTFSPAYTDYEIEEIVIVGGTCCLKNIEKIIESRLGIKVKKPNNPMFVTPLGIAKSCKQKPL